LVDYLYDKLLIRKKRIKGKYLDNILDLYLNYTSQLNYFYKQTLDENINDTTKYTLYLIVNSCITEYLNSEKDFNNKLNRDTTILEEELKYCVSIGKILRSFIFKEIKKGEDELTEKDKEVMDSISKMSEKLGNIEKVLEDISYYLSDYVNKIVYTIQIEYQEQVNYAKRENEKILLNVSKELKKLLFDVNHLIEK